MKKESVMDIRESYYKFHKFLLKLRLSLSLISKSAWTTGSHNLWESLIAVSFGFFCFLWIPPIFI